MLKESVNVLSLSITILSINYLHCENRNWKNALYRLEKGMAIYSSILAWRTPGTEEPGKLQFIGLRVRQDWTINTPIYTTLYRQREEQDILPYPFILLPYCNTRSRQFLANSNFNFWITQALVTPLFFILISLIFFENEDDTQTYHSHKRYKCWKFTFTNCSPVIPKWKMKITCHSIKSRSQSQLSFSFLGRAIRKGKICSCIVEKFYNWCQDKWSISIICTFLTYIVNTMFLEYSLLATFYLKKF